MLLSICIPTLNRAPRVAALVSHLSEVLGVYPDGDVELIVSDNCSSDDTWDSLSQMAESPFLRMVRRDSYIKTGEEHFIRLVEESSGDFVWVLGDDDLPNPKTLECLVSYLREDVADIYLFNHREITSDGSIYTESMMPMNRAWIDIKGRDLVHAAGFISTFSMFSNVVFRRGPMLPEVGRSIYQLSPIYSHVAWYIECFSSLRARVVNMPLVNHRADFSSIQTYFAGYCQKEQHGKYHVWTSGLVALLRYLLSKGLLSSVDLQRIYEHEFDGRRYRLMDKIIHYVFLQIESSVHALGYRDPHSREIFSSVEFKRIYDTLLVIDPALQDQLFILKKMHDLTLAQTRGWRRDYRKSRARFIRLHQEQEEWNMYASNLLGVYYGYSVYRSLVGYVAIANIALQSEIFDYEQVLGFLDPVEYGHWVLVDEVLELLIERLRDASLTIARLEVEGMKSPMVLRAERKRSHLYEALFDSLTLFRWMGLAMTYTRHTAVRFIKRAHRWLRKIAHP